MDSQAVDRALVHVMPEVYKPWLLAALVVHNKLWLLTWSSHAKGSAVRCLQCEVRDIFGSFLYSFLNACTLVLSASLLSLLCGCVNIRVFQTSLVLTYSHHAPSLLPMTHEHFEPSYIHFDILPCCLLTKPLLAVLFCLMHSVCSKAFTDASLFSRLQLL